METTVAQYFKVQTAFDETGRTIGVFATGRLIIAPGAAFPTLHVVFDIAPSALVAKQLRTYGFRKMHGRLVYSCTYDQQATKCQYQLVFAEMITDAVVLDPEAGAILQRVKEAHWKLFNNGSAKARMEGLLTEWSLAYFPRR